MTRGGVKKREEQGDTGEIAKFHYSWDVIMDLVTPRTAVRQSYQQDDSNGQVGI